MIIRRFTEAEDCDGFLCDGCNEVKQNGIIMDYMTDCEGDFALFCPGCAVWAAQSLLNVAKEILDKRNEVEE